MHTTCTPILNDLIASARFEIVSIVVNDPLLTAAWPSVEAPEDNAQMFREAQTRVTQLAVEDMAARVDRTLGLVRGFVAILQHHRASSEVITDFVRQMTRYTNVQREDQFVSRAKYVCSFALARYLSNPLPPSDDPYKPSGKFGRWVRSRFAMRSARNTHLWSSWNQAKRAALQLSEHQVLMNYAKHRDRMVAADPARDNFELVNDVMMVLTPIITKLRDKLEGLESDYSRKTSLKACVERSRARGGAQEEIALLIGAAVRPQTDDFIRPSGEEVPHAQQLRELFPHLTNHREIAEDKVTRLAESQWTGLLTKDFLGYEEESRAWFDGHNLRNDPKIIRTDITDFENWTGRANSHFPGEPDRLPADFCAIGDFVGPMRPLTLLEKLAVLESQSPLTCTIQAVLEPLKVRTISKGMAAPYHLSGDYQKALHTAMRRMPCFRLIGRRASPTDLSDIAIREPGMGWFSIDFEASTDNISRRLSECVNNAICLGLGFADVFRACLAAHLCQYPQFELDDRTVGGKITLALFRAWLEKSGAGKIIKKEAHIFVVKINDALQVNAQLMGSRVSFVILCLINLALYLITKLDVWRQSYECNGEDFPSDETLDLWVKSCLINGDDGLFCCTRAFAERFSELARLVGLPLSVGKVYWDPVYANINSTSFHCDLRRPDSTPRQIDYLNVGLVFGQNKVLCSDKKSPKSDDNEEVVPQLISTIARVLEGALPGRQSDVLKTYLSLHKNELSKQSKRRNLFIHPSLGGWGVPRPVGWKFDVTRPQIAEAVLRMRQAGEYESAARPFQSRVIERESQECLFTPWRDLSPVAELGELDRVWTGMRSLTWQQRNILEVGIVRVAKRCLQRRDVGHPFEGVLSDNYLFNESCQSLEPLC